jgi:histidinol-phosphate aminotransferase
MKVDATTLDRFIRPNIVELEPYHCARETVQDGVLLDANENPFPRLEGAVLLNRYPDPYQRRLRQALAARLGVSSEMILAGTGSDEVLDWVFKVFDVAAGIAVAEPTYGMYRVLADIYSVPVHEFRLSEKFQFLGSDFLEWVPAQVRLLFVCSPNNPTGNTLDRNEIFRVADSWDGIVVVDEAYIEFSGESSLASDVEDYPNLVVLRTFSKAFGRAGVRLGYTVAHPELVGYFLKVKAPYNLNAWVMEQGVQALQSAGETAAQIELILQERARIGAALQRMGGVEEVFPSRANFILFRCRQPREICRRLLDEGIIVRDRSSMPGLEGCIRVTVGTPTENDLFLARLQELLERL